ncbi:hypothetical protein OXPF_14530 [Oxobacter pfennigii]|uniref:DUF2500 domain-containing protein n=1 Tax=Oxobacter pfennigii TaxID=36849 RepID=A0A0P8W8H4_9CLOT|nr:DUF2500 domain-containing protein [Oxobacter pfennigii]KPU44975.1 hypothetical protein OXPF_14530 [Oxobacter pfennigii]
MDPFGGFGSIMFTIIPLMVFMGFIFVFGMIIFSLVRGATQWKKNNQSPILTVPAAVVTKRTDVHHHSHHHHNSGTNNIHHSSSSTTYYVTFEVESGSRMEFHVHDNEYGMLVEGDMGKLTFQGTRYLGFERIK